MITYVDVGLLWNSTYDDETKKKRITELITHEYTHQFFGNIVSPQFWTYTWLNEGFATLFANVIPSFLYPDEDYIYRFHVGAQAAAFNFDQANKSVSMNHYVEIPDEIEGKFNAISYSKAGSVLRMIQQAIGQDIFAKGLSYYLDKMKFSSATPEDLHESLQKALDELKPGSGIDLEKIMTSWENQAGYPIIEVQQTITSTNSYRYTSIQSSSTGGNEIYEIPITFMSPSQMTASKVPKFFMTQKEWILETSDSWILLNLYRDGYYKVKYDDNIWKGMLKALNANLNQIPLMNRVFIYDEVPWEIVQSKSGLDLLNTLTSETESIIWLRVGKVESLLAYYFVGSELWKIYDEFILSKVESHVKRLGYEGIDGESYKNADLRRSVVDISCKHLNAECLKFKFEKFKMNPYSVPYADLCHSFRHMDDKTYNELSLEFSEYDVTRFSDYFTCSLNEDFLNERGFKQFFEEPSNNTNVFTLVHNAMTTEFGANKLLDFLVREIEVIPRM